MKNAGHEERNHHIPHCRPRSPSQSAGRIAHAGSRQGLIDFRADPDTQARISELGDKCNEGQLTLAEQAEYEAYVPGHRPHRHPPVQGPPAARQDQKALMDGPVRTAVRERAQFHCEYCRLAEEHAPVTPFQVEHIVARQHGGSDAFRNLALACHRCNLTN